MSGVPPPPNLKACDAAVYAAARFMRHNETLKSRPALLAGQRYDIFRCKRAVRALLSDEYKKKQQNPKSGLPEVKTREDALKLLAQLPPEHFAMNVAKLETEDALAQGLKPQSGVPVVLIAQHQRVGDDEYMVWLYNPMPLKTRLYGVGLLLAGAALAFFQMWPRWARQGAYYVSMCSIALLAALTVLGVIRLILFVGSLFFTRGFWLFPNLFADVGFFQSFRPVWSWSGENTLPVKPKRPKRKSKAKAAGEKSASVAEAPKGAAAAAAAAAAASTASPLGATPAAAAAPTGAPAGALPPGAVPPNVPLDSLLVAKAKMPNGQIGPVLLLYTAKGMQVLGPANVRVTPAGPLVMTPAGPMPLEPNGVVKIPPAAKNQIIQRIQAGQQASQQPGVQEAIERSVKRAEARVQEEVKKGSKEPVEAMRMRFVREEAKKEPQLVELQQKMGN